MSDPVPQAKSPIRCEVCGTALAGSGETCPRCSADPYRSPALVDAHTVPRYSLATLFGIVTVVAVCLGIGLVSPVLGIGAALLCTPALIRTGIAMQRRMGRGEPITFETRAVFFLGSVGVMTGLAVAAGVAFYATCWAGFAAGASLSSMAGAPNYAPIVHGAIVGAVLGIAVGILVLVWLGRKFLPIERRAKNLPPS